MRKILLGAAAVFAVAAPGLASAEVGGTITGTYGSLDEQGDPGKEDVWAIGGAVVNNLGNNWVLQFDGALADMDHGSHTDSFELFQGHAAYDFGNFTAGAFVGRFDWGGGSPYNVLGVEGQTTFGQFSLGAAASVAEYNDGGGSDLSNIAVNGAYQLTEAFSINGLYSHTDWDGDESDTFGLGVGYAIPNTNFTVGAGYRTFEADSGTETDAFGLSFGWNFGDHVSPMTGANALLSDAVLYQ